MLTLAIYADNAHHAHYVQNGEENIKQTKTSKLFLPIP